MNKKYYETRCENFKKREWQYDDNDDKGPIIQAQGGRDHKGRRYFSRIHLNSSKIRESGEKANYAEKSLL